MVYPDEVITGGKVDIKITYNIFPYKITYNLCDLTKKVNHTCPLKKGKVSITVPTKIPKEAPKVSTHLEQYIISSCMANILCGDLVVTSLSEV